MKVRNRTSRKARHNPAGTKLVKKWEEHRNRTGKDYSTFAEMSGFERVKDAVRRRDRTLRKIEVAHGLVSALAVRS